MVKQYEITMGLVCWSALFLQVPWGFISFGSTAMIEYDNYGIDEVGILLTSVAVAMVFGVLIIGEVGDKLDPKMLLTGGLLFCSAGAFGIVVIDNFWALLGGFILQGVGISVWRVVPYNQLTQIVPIEYYPRWYGWYEVCMSMLSAGGARMLMMISTVMFKNRWGWRLPWAFVCAFSVLNFFLILFFGKFDKSKKKIKKNMKKMKEHSYFEKFNEFIHNPIGVCLFCSLACAGFGFLSLAAWAPYISVEKFKADYDQVQITMAIAATVAYPVSVGGCAYLVYKTMGHIEEGLKYSIIFIIPAFVAAFYVSLADSFMSFVIPTVIFLALGFFPYSYYKVIPELLELPEDLTLFVLSYFSVAWTLFGEVLASVTITQIMKRYGVRMALYVVSGVVGLSAFFWLICSYWAFTNKGPIKKIIEIRKARTKQNAHSAWRHLRHAIIFTARAKKHQKKILSNIENKNNAKNIDKKNEKTASVSPEISTSSSITLPPIKTTSTTSSKQTPDVSSKKKVRDENESGGKGDIELGNMDIASTNKDTKKDDTKKKKDEKVTKKKDTKKADQVNEKETTKNDESIDSDPLDDTTTKEKDEKENEEEDGEKKETVDETPPPYVQDLIDDTIESKVRKFKGAVYLVMLCNSFSHGVPHSMLGELEGIQQEEGIKI